MFEDYKEIQGEFYDAIYQSVALNNKISHAYLIDDSNFAKVNELVLSFAKFLICKNHHVNNDSCDDCNICKLIDNKTDDHIQIIEPDGLWIKKEQLANLKKSLSKKSLDNYLQVYIIKEAEKLNKAAANSLLKFLEEPEEGIVAILVTNNRYQVLPTILSRCQIYSLKNINETVKVNDYQDMFDFIMDLERNGVHSICYVQSLWHSKYNTKIEFIENFNKLEEMFLDFINYKIKNETEFDDNAKDIDFILKRNTEQSLVRKLSVILKCRELIQYNVNLSLLMDKFIIDYVGGEKFD